MPLLLRSLTLAGLLLVAASPAAAPADDWPDYRGPLGDGRVPGRALPLRWSEGEHVTWKVALPGRGWSTPVLADGRIWMTTAADKGRRRMVLCVDQTTGRMIHAFTLFHVRSPEPCHALNSHASPSPVVRGDRLFVHFGAAGTACLDTGTAREIWTREDLPLEHVVGPGSSPILVDDRLVFHQDGANRQYVIALDAATGRNVWVAPRAPELFELHREHRKAFSTPLAITIEGRRQLVSVGASAAVGLDPANGAVLWRVPHGGYSGASRPVVGHGLAIFSTGFDVADLVAVRLSDAAVAWRYERNVPWITSPVLDGDLLFTVSYPGVTTCLDARTGERIWRRRLGAEFCASPLASEGRVYMFDREGTCTVLAADRDGEVLATNTLDEGMMASPAAADGALFLRTTGHLYRIDAPAP